jgi:hypothetical protein
MRSRTTSAARAPSTSAVPDPDTQSFDVPATEPQPTPVSYAQVERRTFGLAPHSLVAALAAGALGAAVALLAAEHPVAGLLLLALALFLGALFAEQARRRRGTSVERATAAAVDGSRAYAGFAGASVRAWTSTCRRVAQLRLEARGLARDRSRLIGALGVAAYDRDDDVTAELRGRIRSIDARLEACVAESTDAVEAARRRTAEERLAVGATEVHGPRRGAE